MRISNRVKRNVSFALLLLGLACVAARGWSVFMTPHSGKAWFEFVGMIIITWCPFDSFRIYSRRLRNGILYGSESQN